MLLVAEFLDTDQGRYFFVGLEGQNIGDRLPTGRPAHLGNFVNLLHIHSSSVREKHQVVVRRGREEVFDKIARIIPLFLLLGLHAKDALPAASLGPVAGDGGPFDVAGMRKGDHRALLRDQVLHVDLPFVLHNLGAAGISVFLLNLEQLLFDDRVDLLLAGQNTAQLLDLLDDGEILLLDLIPLQAGQLVQPQFQDRVSLPVAQLVLCDQLFLGQGTILGGTDDLYEVVQVREGLLVPLKNVGPIFGHLEVKLRAADDHLAAVFEIANQHLPHGQEFWTAAVEGQHDHPEAAFQRCEFVEIVNDHLRDRIPFQLQNDANGLIGLVAGVTDALELFLFHEIGHPLDQLFRVHIVRNLGDDQLGLAGAPLFHGDLATQLQGSSSRLVIVCDRFPPTNQSTSRKIRSGHDF